ncbi:class I SAM-dependent methyltransferase [Paenibacillus barcinonensis]|uniref:class I SAM-dependent methyltransferase n=1 Tax=Paenibacillus barcinonensis TaxID=198119 RepID=UPI00209DF9D0|nr:class I SAM-dependent methyltransferase [Paenibacillus barcinonensis]
MEEHIYDKVTQVNGSPAMSWDTADLCRYEQSISLKIPGYDHMHHMMEKLLAASITDNNDIHILVTGAGGGKELTLLGASHREWQLTGMDTSIQMLKLAQQKAEEAGITARTILLQGTIENLPEAALYDGATCMLMLHFIQGMEAKKTFLKHLSQKLKPGAPLIIAAVNADLASPVYPVMMQAWREHMLQAGIFAEEWERFAASLGEQSDPVSGGLMVQLLAECGFSRMTRFFGAFWVEAYYAIRD